MNNKLPPAFERARDYLNKGNCKEAWEVLWQLARRGDRDAVFAIVEMLLLHEITPPGWEGEYPAPANYQKRMFSLIIYATLSRGQFFEHDPYRAALPKAIPSIVKEFNLGKPGTLVAECYRRGSKSETCVDLAQTLALMPKFYDLVREFDTVSQTSGVPASCVPPR